MIYLIVTLGLTFIILWVVGKKLARQPKSLQGKVVLITGSANGMGRMMVKKFAELGCRVVCVDVDDERNETIVNEVNSTYPGRAKAYSCNIAVAEDIQKLKVQVLEDFGAVNILVNNAAIAYHNPSPIESNEEHLKAIIAINIIGLILMVNAFLADMLKRNEGHVIATSSLGALVVTRQLGVYEATKAACKSYMESLAFKLENIPNNEVKTTIVYPTLVDTHPFITERSRNTYKAMSPDRAASAIVRGVVQESKNIFIPNSFRYVAFFLSLLPFKLLCLFMKRYEADFGLLTEEACRHYRINTIVPVTNKKIAENAPTSVDQTAAI